MKPLSTEYVVNYVNQNNSLHKLEGEKKIEFLNILSANKESVERINLSGMKYLNKPEKQKIVFANFLSKFSNLREIYLADCDLTPKAAAYILRFFAERSEARNSLEYIDLSQNFIDLSGEEIIAIIDPLRKDIEKKRNKPIQWNEYSLTFPNLTQMYDVPII